MSKEKQKVKIFAGDIYYPRGGYKDFKGRVDSIEEALIEINNLDKKMYCWAQIVVKDKILLEGNCEGENGKRDEWQWEST